MLAFKIIYIVLSHKERVVKLNYKKKKPNKKHANNLWILNKIM